MPTVYQYKTENLAIGDVYGGHDPNRYYLNEYFEKVPSTNSAIEQKTLESDGVTTKFADLNVANKSFEFKAVGTSSACSFNQDGTGINLVTDVTSGDNVIVLPHEDSNLSAWNNIYWKTSSQTHWACALKINNISDVFFWAGLKIDEDSTIDTNANQAYFLFDPNTSSSSFTNVGNLHFVYTISNTHYVTDLGIVVAADTIYKLRIEIDSNRQVQVYVNDTLYGLSTTEGTSGNTAVNALVKSLPLVDDDTVYLKPIVGVQTNTTAAKTLNLCYEHISKVIS